MKHPLILMLALLFSSMTYSQIAITKIFIVRHADRLGQADDLSALGVARANELRRTLGLSNIDSVFSTNFVRTVRTATPLATANNVPVIRYSTELEVINRIKAKSSGKRVLVVGHSNTVASLIQLCGCKTPPSITPDIPATQFDNLFLVIMHKQVNVLQKPKCELIHMKYGAITN